VRLVPGEVQASDLAPNTTINAAPGANVIAGNTAQGDLNIRDNTFNARQGWQVVRRRPNVKINALPDSGPVIAGNVAGRDFNLTVNVEAERLEQFLTTSAKLW
jgi:hypothetical protein